MSPRLLGCDAVFGRVATGVSGHRSAVMSRLHPQMLHHNGGADRLQVSSLSHSLAPPVPSLWTVGVSLKSTPIQRTAVYNAVLNSP